MAWKNKIGTCENEECGKEEVEIFKFRKKWICAECLNPEIEIGDPRLRTASSLYFGDINRRKKGKVDLRITSKERKKLKKKMSEQGIFMDKFNQFVERENLVKNE